MRIIRREERFLELFIPDRGFGITVKPSRRLDGRHRNQLTPQSLRAGKAMTEAAGKPPAKHGEAHGI
jgi:hypothetical protein